MDPSNKFTVFKKNIYNSNNCCKIFPLSPLPNRILWPAYNLRSDRVNVDSTRPQFLSRHEISLGQTYPNISGHIQTYPDISRHIQTYPDISRHIQIYPHISTHIQTWTQSRSDMENFLSHSMGHNYLVSMKCNDNIEYDITILSISNTKG